MSETTATVEEDFNTVLGESKASLKRSLVFVGGIIRGYLRRGRNREFIRTMRRLEARSKQSSETDLLGDVLAGGPSSTSTSSSAASAASGSNTSKALNQALEEAGMHGLIAPMQAYIAPPRLTINVVRRTGSAWDTIAKLWQFRNEPQLLSRVAVQVEFVFEYFV